jgi:hypothetical protein
MDRLNSAWMRTALLAALPLSMATVPGCMAEPASGSDVEDWGDPVAYPDLGGAYANLTPLTGTCTFVTLTGVMTINGMDTAQTIIIGRRAVDSAILVNGSTCGSPAATATTLKVLNVNASMAGDQVLILDFINGLFATGTAISARAPATPSASAVPPAPTSSRSAPPASRSTRTPTATWITRSSSRSA